MTDNTEVATRTHQPNILATASLPERMNYAHALAGSGLLPDSFRGQPANVLIGIELATALNLAPIIVLNELAVIGGRPSWSAKFMRSQVRRAGHRLRETFKNGTATVVIIRADDPGFEHTAIWSEAKARKHDYWGKGHWKKNPELMLKNRAVSECVREACPEVLVGVVYTSDELLDFVPGATQDLTIPEPEQQATQERQNHPQDAPEGERAVPVREPITQPQHAKIGALMSEANIKGRAAAIAYVIGVVGRPIQSRNDLSKAEAGQVIQALEAGPQEDIVDAEFVEEGQPASQPGVDAAYADWAPIDPETGEAAL